MRTLLLAVLVVFAIIGAVSTASMILNHGRDPAPRLPASSSAPGAAGAPTTASSPPESEPAPPPPPAEENITQAFSGDPDFPRLQYVEFAQGMFASHGIRVSDVHRGDDVIFRLTGSSCTERFFNHFRRAFTGRDTGKFGFTIFECVGNGQTYAAPVQQVPTAQRVDLRGHLDGDEPAASDTEDNETAPEPMGEME